MSNYIAMDCEMVGSGNRSLLARVSLVNNFGSLVYDKYVKPTETVTDYRTFVSGIKQHHLNTGENFNTVQREVQNLIRGKILVGHSLHFDLAALGLTHPERDIRDIAKYEPFKRLNNGNTPSLQLLAQHYLNQRIQSGEHDSAEDAKVAIKVYQTGARNWP
ncbi:PREDICTED: RNA exonuclease 4-like [Papilio xuthus]|uniref:RNA exonuclease 4 n=1 Tax=Papilio xuthus TaxID=66420 RepID=A0AAJ6ZBJ2_PAPXU